MSSSFDDFFLFSFESDFFSLELFLLSFNSLMGCVTASFEII